MRTIKVRQHLKLLHTILDSIPDGSKISFEGDLKKQLTPGIEFTEKEEGCLTRNTRTPKQDFWVFKIDSKSRDYLKKNFMNRIGISKNVIHIMAEDKGKLLFASYDNFFEDNVLMDERFFQDNNFAEFISA